MCNVCSVPRKEWRKDKRSIVCGPLTVSALLCILPFRSGIVRGSLDVEPLNWLAVIFSGCQWMELSKQWMSVDVSGSYLHSFGMKLKFYRYCLALFISELMKMISFQYNCQCMLLVSSRWLTSYASKWGGGSKAVLASSGWLKIVLEISE